MSTATPITSPPDLTTPSRAAVDTAPGILPDFCMKSALPVASTISEMSGNYLAVSTFDLSITTGQQRFDVYLLPEDGVANPTTPDWLFPESLSMLFSHNYINGKVCLRLQAIKQERTRARLQVTWVPSLTPIGSLNNANVNERHIWDLAVTDTYERECVGPLVTSFRSPNPMQNTSTINPAWSSAYIEVSTQPALRFDKLGTIFIDVVGFYSTAGLASDTTTVVVWQKFVPISLAHYQRMLGKELHDKTTFASSSTDTKHV